MSYETARRNYIRENASDVTRAFINGNRTGAREILINLTRDEAMAVVLLAYRGLSKDNQESFMQYIETIAL